MALKEMAVPSLALKSSNSLFFTYFYLLSLLWSYRQLVWTVISSFSPLFFWLKLPPKFTKLFIVIQLMEMNPFWKKNICSVYNLKNKIHQIRLLFKIIWFLQHKTIMHDVMNFVIYICLIWYFEHINSKLNYSICKTSVTIFL